MRQQLLSALTKQQDLHLYYCNFSANVMLEESDLKKKALKMQTVRENLSCIEKKGNNRVVI